MADRDTIPGKVKREVRQRDGFGCVFCGYPLVRYHHIIHHADGGLDTSENLVSVCSNCHDEIHAGILQEEDLAAAMKNPAPFDPKVARKRTIRPKKIAIKLGNQLFSATEVLTGVGFAPFSILDYRPLSLRFENGVPLISMEIFASDGTFALRLIDNEIIQKADVFDIEWVGSSITLRGENRLILFRAEIGEIFYVKEAVFVHGEHIVWISDRMTYLNSLCEINIVSFVNCPVGFGIGASGFCAISEAPVYFDYEDTVDWIKGEKIPVSIEKLRRVVDYYNVPKEKTAPTAEDEELYLKHVMPGYEKRPAWLKDLAAPTSVRPKYRDMNAKKV